MLGWFGATHPSVNAHYTYAGEAESPDGKAHVIDVKNADGFAARLFIDEQTHLPLMVTYQGPQPRMVDDRRAAPRRGGAPGRSRRRTARPVTEEDRRRLRGGR